MNFTFGIVTANVTETYIDEVIDSIRSLSMPHYEIIVVGGSQSRGDVFIDFPDDLVNSPGWITRKKNLISKHARYDNVVYMHDYLACNSDWYDGFKKFGDSWDVCMCRLIKRTGDRYRDWCVYYNNDRSSIFWSGTISGCDDPDLPAGTVNVPYEYNKTQYMYISGAYWVAKKDFMLKYPLDEKYRWGQGEDVVWARSVRNVWNYKMNTYSSMRLLKDK
jgi:glycosyltransferase involved in cell wall biosynthesis